MNGRVGFDDSELRKLELDLRKAPLRVRLKTREGMGRVGRLVKREMRVDAFNARRKIPTSIPNLPDAITYTQFGDYEVEVGMGPRTGGGGQGSLAHIIVYGSVNNAPVYDHTAGLRRAEPDVLNVFANGAEESVLGGDGVE